MMVKTGIRHLLRSVIELWQLWYCPWDLGEPTDPCAVWKKLGDQFLKKSWGNKLELRRKLHSLRLFDGESVQEHIRRKTELFHALGEVDTPLSEEDRVVYLLASLPDSFGVLVTASENVPRMEVVIERLLHEERKMNNCSAGNERAMNTRARRMVRCYHCKGLGHFKRDCPKLVSERDHYQKEQVKHKSHNVKENCDSSDEGILLAQQSRYIW